MDLLGRSRELGRIGQALDAAVAGAGKALFVEGPAGIGKTRLLEAARELAAARGMRVLAARGGELERRFAYGVVRQLLEPELAGATAAERDELFEGPGAPARPVFFGAGEAEAGGEDRSFGVLDGLFWLLWRLSERRPLALAVDDLHWCDGSSLRLLDFLGRRLDGLPVAVVGTVRPNEPGADARLLASLIAQPSAGVLRPPPLNEEACARLVRTLLSEQAADEFCLACRRATGGNPLLLRELIREVAEAGIPPDADHAEGVAILGGEAVSGSVARQLARLPAGARALVEAAAVLGEGAGLAHASRLAGLDDEAVFDAVETLEGLDLVRVEVSRIDFVHPVVRASVYAGLGPGRAARAHARAAELLREAGSPAEQVASHLLAVPARGDARAVATLRAAADASLAAGGVQEAVAFLRRASEEPPPESMRAELLIQLGLAERMLDGRAAAEHLSAALPLIDEPARKADVAHSLAWTLFLCARPLEGAEAAAAALAALGDGHPTERRRLEAIRLDIATMVPALNRLAGELDAALRDEATAGDAGARMIALLLAYRDARSLALPAEAAARQVESALDGSALLGIPDATGAVVLGAVTLAAADSPAALELADRAVAEARRRGSILLLASATMVRAHAQLARGALAAAAGDAEQALEAIGSYQVLGGAAPYASVPLAEALMKQGDLGGATRALERGGYREELPDNLNLHGFVDCRIRLRLLRGDVRGALDETLRSGRRFEALGGRNPALLPWRSRAALCLARLGEDPTESRRLAAEELELAREWGAARAIARALRAQGLVTGGAAGLRLLSDASDALDGTLARLERAHALVDLGAALRRANRRADARVPLSEAIRLAGECGATALEMRAREELVAAGGRPRLAALSGPESLTPSERRVARLAAGGLTNRDIAKTLFVTPKTVEKHLRNAYAKLDVHSRAQLSDALGEGESGAPAAAAS